MADFVIKFHVARAEWVVWTFVFHFGCATSQPHNVISIGQERETHYVFFLLPLVDMIWWSAVFFIWEQDGKKELRLMCTHACQHPSRGWWCVLLSWFDLAGKRLYFSLVWKEMKVKVNECTFTFVLWYLLLDARTTKKQACTTTWEQNRFSFEHLNDHYSGMVGGCQMSMACSLCALINACLLVASCYTPPLTTARTDHWARRVEK